MEIKKLKYPTLDRMSLSYPLSTRLMDHYGGFPMQWYFLDITVMLHTGKLTLAVTAYSQASQNSSMNKEGAGTDMVEGEF